MRVEMAVLCVAALIVPAALPVRALESAYTKVDFDGDCHRVTETDGGGSWTCKGYRDYPIHFAEGDLRQSAFYGEVGPWHQDTAFESFWRFNHAGDKAEWRLDEGRPVATIRRWFLAAGDDKPDGPEVQVLVISKVGQKGVGDACVAGYVEASRNPDANAAARKVADTIAPDFACRVAEPQWHGARKHLDIQPMRSFGD